MDIFQWIQIYHIFNFILLGCFLFGLISLKKIMKELSKKIDELSKKMTGLENSIQIIEIDPPIKIKEIHNELIYLQNEITRKMEVKNDNKRIEEK